jgi:hypothetical protein
MWRIWSDRAAKSPSAPLPPIIPVLVSHADGGWTGPLRFADLFGDTLARHPELIEFVPDFAAVLEDLQQRDDASLDGAALQPGVVMTLVALRDARRADIVERLRRHMKDLRALAALRDATALMQRLTRYLIAAAPDLPLADFHAILTEASAEDVMPTIAEELRNQGRAEALRATVRRQIALKFGELAEQDARRLEEASNDELEQFLDRVVVADSVDAVLRPDA